MLDLTIKRGAKNVDLHLPTESEEILNEYLTGVTNDVVVNPNYALVALVVSDKLSTLLAPTKKDVSVKAFCLFVRANDPNNYLNANTGDKLICAPTDVMRGIEVTSSANVLSPSKVASLITQDKDIMATLFSYVTPVYLVTFKLVPISDIHGSYITMSDEDYDEATKIANKYLS